MSSGTSRATAENGVPDIPDYEMLRVIGRGSYGDVWLARGITGIYRAIKVVWRDRFADAGPYEREFKGLKEFAAISLGESIQMALLHIGRSDDAGYFYYVMELADDAARGRDIVPASYVPLTLTEARKRRGRLPAAECVGIGADLARVLAGLHKRGLVHRDIKPSNIIFVVGVAKLADIGLVTPAGEASTFVGTEGFVPPEGPGSPSADVFALGKVIYELATGLDRQEFPKLPAEVRRLPDCKALFELNELILHACERDAAKRYADGVAFLADLLALQAGSSLRARRVGKNLLRWAAMAVMAVILVGGGMGLWKRRSSVVAAPQASAPRPVAVAVADNSIAVLRFSNLSGDAAQEYFSEGISDELISLLGRVPGLVVKGRSSSFFFTGKQATAQEKGQKLGVTYLVDGSVRRMGSTVRITAQLTRAATDEVVWSSEPLTRDVKDVFAVQDEIAGLIAQALSLKLGASFAAATAPVNPQAFDFYWQARQALNLRTLEGFARAEDLLNRALGLDRNFARAHAALADVWLQRESSNARLVAFGQRDSPVLARIVAKIQEALALDPNSAEAHASLGLAFGQRWQMEASVQELRQAIALNPNYANAHHWLGRALAVDGRMDEALPELKRAAELDPFAPTILDNYAWFLCFAGRHREAEAIIERVEILQPNLAQAARRRVGLLLQQGRNAEAMAVARAITPTNQTGVISKIFALADVGLKTEAEALLPELTEESWLPNALAAIGRHEESIAAFTEARLTRLSLNLFFYERACDPIRDDPRLRRLLAVVGATEAHARAQAWRQSHPPEKPTAKK